MQEQPTQQQETLLPYDMVPLPSQGIFYPNNKKSVKVSYLNASDENLLASQVSKEGNLVNSLISRKMLDKDIIVEDMADCDKEAILVFLRNTAFGPEYQVKLTDPKTNEEFDATVDLSVLKTRDMEVELDENMEFDFFLEQSKKKVKLSFLSPEDEKYLKGVDEQYKDQPVSPFMTKQLEKMVKEIDGIRDSMTLSQVIQTMPISDAQSIRKIVRQNTPNLDLLIPVQSPSNETLTVRVTLGVEFFRPFYGL